MEIVKCKNLTKNFSRLVALDNIDLSIEAGQPIALVGPNGAGKTTLISVISGFIRPTKGDVKVFGAGPGSASSKNRFSVLPQDAQFDPNFTVGSQLKLYAKLRGLRSADAEVQRVLGLVQLQDRIRSKPEDLSHGMRKRLLIAQALLGTPELIILDEPTAGIDPPNARLIRDLIVAESGNTTFIVSSHNLDELEKVCNRVIHLTDGRLVSQGVISDTATEEGFLTVVTDSDISHVIQSLAGLKNVTENQGNEYIIEFNHQSNPQFHISLLQILADENIRYKRLINGRTLEEKMYSSNAVSS